MGPDLLDMPFVPLPEITPETKLSKDVEHCLEYSGGKPLLYFATYKELCKFFVEVLKWENTPSALLPDLQYKKEFVIYANAKGMLIAHDVAAYFVKSTTRCTMPNALLPKATNSFAVREPARST